MRCPRLPRELLWTRCVRRPTSLAVLVALATATMLIGCAAARSPVLYPNAKVKETAAEQVKRDVAECRELADEHVKSSAGRDVAAGAAVGGATGGAAGAAGGAVRGAMTRRGAGEGAAIGAATGAAAGAAAGAVHGAVKQTEPSPVYKQFVSRCLRDRGYEVIGWQ